MHLIINAFIIILIGPLLVVTMCESKEVTIYKSVNKDGTITYSDQAHQNSEKINITPQNSITIKQPSKRKPAISQENKQPPTLKITSLIDHQTIRDNQGNITVNAQISQRIPTSYRYQLIIDEKIHATQALTPNFSVKNIDRGAHKIKMALVDDKGKVIALSGSYNIYMHRASIN